MSRTGGWYLDLPSIGDLKPQKADPGIDLFYTGQDDLMESTLARHPRRALDMGESGAEGAHSTEEIGHEGIMSPNAIVVTIMRMRGLGAVSHADVVCI